MKLTFRKSRTSKNQGNTAKQLDNGGIVSSFYLKKRYTRAGLAIVVLTAVLLSGFYLWQKNSNNNQPQEPIGDEVTTPIQRRNAVVPQQEIDRAKQRFSINATIVKLDGDELTVRQTDGKTLVLKTTADTTYRKGKTYTEGEKSELQPGQDVLVTYNPSDKTVLVIWYDR